MKASRKKALGWVLLGLAACVGAGVVYLHSIGIAYGFYKLVFYDYYYASHYSMPSGKLMNYTGEWMRKVKYNPKTGVRDLAWALDAPGPSKFDELELGKMSWHQGEFAKAIQHIEAYHKTAPETEESLFWLAMSYQRLGETENCL